MSISLTPLNGYVLVELGQQYKNFSTVEGKYDSRTNGVVIKVTDPEYDYLLAQRVFFEDFKEGGRIERDSRVFSFIDIKDIRGFEQVT